MKRVLVYGHFRAVHVGHFRLFRFAKSQGDLLIVGIVHKERNPVDIEFTRTLINSTGLVDEIFEADELTNLLKCSKANLVVRGHEFRSGDDQDSKTIRNLGIGLKFASEDIGLSEAELRDPYSSSVVLRKSFRDYFHKQGFSKDDIKACLNKIKGLQVTVVGDLVIDEYIECKTLGMSQEEPILVSSPVTNSRYLGGAGIVALHCSALGAETQLISRVGLSEVDDWAKNELDKHNVTKNLIVSPTYRVPLKQRFKSGLHTLFRINHLPKSDTEVGYEDQIIQEVKDAKDSNLWIFSDFSYGTLDASVSEKLVSIIRENSMTSFIAADSQSSSQVGSLGKFTGSDLVAATEHEARLELKDRATGLSILSSMLQNHLKARFTLLKLGSDGCILSGFEPDGTAMPTELIPSANIRAFDTAGAGDSLLAVSATLMAAGIDFRRASLIGSLAAGLQVSKRGNTPISIGELTKLVDEI